MKGESHEEIHGSSRRSLQERMPTGILSKM